ncbi:MAG: insulinase family protein, partial [Acidobacteriota bacterium]|nr:insulinase family protein [Acidobacteriota bacterium]
MRQYLRAAAAFLLPLIVVVSQPVIGQQTRPAGPQEARTVALDVELPFDPDVRFGTFGNGLTYFIRANKRPENRAELRLVVDAGSVLEDDDQLGMAHLLEHM